MLICLTELPCILYYIMLFSCLYLLKANELIPSLIILYIKTSYKHFCLISFYKKLIVNIFNATLDTQHNKLTSQYKVSHVTIAIVCLKRLYATCHKMRNMVINMIKSIGIECILLKSKTWWDNNMLQRATANQFAFHITLSAKYLCKTSDISYSFKYNELHYSHTPICIYYNPLSSFYTSSWQLLMCVNVEDTIATNLLSLPI